jgi:hypothetical protein
MSHTYPHQFLSQRYSACAGPRTVKNIIRGTPTDMPLKSIRLALYYPHWGISSRGVLGSGTGPATFVTDTTYPRPMLPTERIAMYFRARLITGRTQRYQSTVLLCAVAVMIKRA